MCIDLFNQLAFWALLVADAMLLFLLIMGIIAFRNEVKEIDAFVKNQNELNTNLKKYQS